MTIALRRRARSQRRDFNDIIDQFRGGTNTLLSEARTEKNQAVQSTNLIQTEDGLWTTRWGSAVYGQALPNGLNIDGFVEYVKSNEATELIAVGNKVYKSTDGGSWTEVTGHTFTAGNQINFLQIEGRLYMTNGVDSLAYYSGGSTLTTYTALSAPANVILTKGAGLSTGSFNYFIQITALNDIGETVGSTEVTTTINKLRDSWAAANEKVDITWDAVVGASRYQIYYSDETGFETLLGSSTTNAFTDDGTNAPNPYIEVPDDNTTGAPKFRQMELSGNRMWATNDPDNKYRVYFSGTGQYMGYFSPFYGGGYIDLEKGGRDIPRSVVHYRTGKGDSIVTVLCSSPEGKGSIWQVELSSTTVGDTSFTVPAAVKIIGSIGTNAPLSVVKVGNAIKFYNKRGFGTLGNKENLLNILSTDEESLAIRPNVRSLVGSQVSKICGYYYDGKVFYSVPESSSGNDHIYVFDTERRNWQISWDLGVRQFGEYTDSGGNTKFLAAPVTGSQLLQISENISGDSGSAFSTQYLSGLYPISRDRTVWAKIKKAYIELGNPRGTISFELLGTQKGKQFQTIGTATITDQISQTGYTWTKYSAMKYSTSTGAPTTFSSSSRRKSIRVNKLLNNYQFKVTTSGINDRYTILSLQVKGKIVPTRDPSTWSD